MAKEVSADVAHRVPGLLRQVEICYDAWRTPHIFAETEADAFFGQGFVAARDRLWQMDLARRRGLGRLAEAFGSLFIPYDHTAPFVSIPRKRSGQSAWRQHCQCRAPNCDRHLDARCACDHRLGRVHDKHCFE